MTTMQQKLTAQFKAVVTDFKNCDLEFVEAPGIAANVGTWHVMDSLDTLVKIGYNFQAGYATFEVTGPLAQAEPADPDRHWHQINGRRELGYHYPHTKYGEGDKIREVLGTVRGLLDSWRRDRIWGSTPLTDGHEHTAAHDGPPDCPRCQLLRENRYWMEPGEDRG